MTFFVAPQHGRQFRNPQARGSSHVEYVVAAYDSEFRYTHISDSIVSVAGLPPAFFIGRTNRELGMTAEAASRWESAIDQVRRMGETVEAQFCFDCPSGPRTFRGRLFPWSLGEAGGASVLCVVRQVRQPRLAGREADRLRITLAATLDALGSCIAILDADARLVAMNSAWKRQKAQTGSRVDSPGADYLAFCEAEAARTGDPAWMEWLSALRHVLSGVRESHEMERPSGTRVFRSRIMRFHDADGSVHLLVQHEDVTAERAAEQARRDAEEQFRHAQKMEAIGRLAGSIAHDFNNLLTAITGYTELLLDSVSSEDRDDLTEVRRAADRAAELVRQLLAFSRRQMLSPSSVDLNRTVAGMSRMLQRLVGETIHLTTSLEPDLPAVFIDAGQVEQVIMNLVVNARDAMPDGGSVEISTAHIGAANGTGPGLAPDESGWVRIAVRDTGHGIDPAVLPKIFDPYFTTKEQGRGTGLGLSTVYGIITQSGGVVTAANAEPGGAEFHVYLPAAPGEAVNSTPLHATDVPGGAELVLLVEDEDVVRAVARRVLEAAGYLVLEARNGPEGLRIASEEAGHIDLVLTDVVMPGMSGHALFRNIADLHPESRVLFMSGYSGDSQVADPFPAEAPLIAKPFTAADLRRRVRETLDRAA